MNVLFNLLVDEVFVHLPMGCWRGYECSLWRQSFDWIALPPHPASRRHEGTAWNVKTVSVVAFYAATMEKLSADALKSRKENGKINAGSLKMP